MIKRVWFLVGIMFIPDDDHHPNETCVCVNELKNKKKKSSAFFCWFLRRFSNFFVTLFSLFVESNINTCYFFCSCLFSLLNVIEWSRMEWKEYFGNADTVPDCLPSRLLFLFRLPCSFFFPFLAQRNWLFWPSIPSILWCEWKLLSLRSVII